MKTNHLPKYLYLLTLALLTLPLHAQMQTFNAAAMNQTYNVTLNGNLTITARGGDGGKIGSGGSGASVVSTFVVQTGDVLTIVAGQRGGIGGGTRGGGGGGGSAVIVSRLGIKTLLLVAGGGGGNGGSNGLNGSGGVGLTNDDAGGGSTSSTSIFNGGGGGGFGSNGSNGNSPGTSGFGNGSGGGTGGSLAGGGDGGVSTLSSSFASDGGFGFGGGGAGSFAGGGGGGYKGGNGGDGGLPDIGGGGGTSFVQTVGFVGTNTSIISGTDGGSTSTGGSVVLNLVETCGPNGQNVKICYYGVTQCVSEKIAKRYRKLGATMGSCGAASSARIGVEETTNAPMQISLKAFPNPIQDLMTLEVLAPKAGPATIEVLDMSGRARQTRREVLVEGLNEIELRLGTLNTGLYLIRAVDAAGRQGVTKVSKQ